MSSSNNLDALSLDGDLPFGHQGRRFDDTPEGFAPSITTTDWQRTHRNAVAGSNVFGMMNRDIDTTVPGVKNAEEIARCVDLPPIPEPTLQRIREIYQRDLR